MAARPPGALQVLSESKSGVPKVHPDRNHPHTTEAEEVFLVSTVPPPCLSPPLAESRLQGGDLNTGGPRYPRKFTLCLQCGARKSSFRCCFSTFGVPNFRTVAQLPQKWPRNPGISFFEANIFCHSSLAEKLGESSTLVWMT